MNITQVVQKYFYGFIALFAVVFLSFSTIDSTEDACRNGLTRFILNNNLDTLITNACVIDTIKEEVFKVVQEMPRFPGCEDLSTDEEKMECAQTKMLQFIFNNIEYPKKAMDNSVQGTIVVRYIVTTTGKIKDIETVRKIGGGCDEAGEKVVAMMPDWIPGKQRGENVNVQFNLPIKFKLDKKTLKMNKKRLKKG